MPPNHLDDRLASLHVALAVVEDAVGREGRSVKLRIVEVEREEIPRLQILDLSAILALAGAGGGRCIRQERPGRESGEPEHQRDGRLLHRPPPDYARALP
jgi:hypothetical protein